MDEREKIQQQVKRQGLEAFLLDQGVGKESIARSKKEIAQTNKNRREEDYYYDKKKTEENVTVPVAQIKGVSRLEGYSWFQMLEYGVLGVPPEISLSSFNLNQNKFLDYLNRLACHDYRPYQHEDNVSFDCYEIGDVREYYGSGDGNHRTITAKIYGVHKLRARSVDHYLFNEQKYHEYQLYKQQKEIIESLIAPLNLSVDKEGLIIFKFNNCYKQINLSFEDLKRDCDSASELKQTMIAIKESLQRVARLAPFYRFLYQRYPKKLKKILYHMLYRENSSYAVESPQEEKGLAKMIALKANWG